MHGAILSQQKNDKVGTGLCREGLHALPKTMFDLFLKAVGTFFEEGHEALPCTGYASPEYPCKCLIVNGAILPQQKSGEVAPVQGRASCPSKNNVRQIFKNGWSILQRLLAFSAVGTFFEEGHEALPCTGYAHLNILASA